MGYEEVETVLPADFVPRPDPVPEQSNAAADEDDDLVENKLLAQVIESEPESEAEDAGCNGLRKKKKKRRSSSRSGSATRGGRKSMLSRWRSGRSKSRGRKSKKESSSGSNNAEGGEKGEKKKKRSKSKSKLGFRTIGKVDSNATEIRSNTTKSKGGDRKVAEGGEAKANDDDEVAAINNADNNAASVLSTVREGSPSNTTVTELTGEKSNHGEQENNNKAVAPSPAPTNMSAATEISIEVGDENEQIEIPIESPFRAMEQREVVEAPAPAPAEEPFPILSAPSRDDASARSGRSAKSNRSARSAKSSASVAASVKSSRSTRSKKSVVGGSGGSIKTAKSTESINKSSSKDVPEVAAAMSGDASVRSTKSTKSSASVKSTKSTSSRRSLRSLKLGKSKSKEVAVEETTALVIVDEDDNTKATDEAIDGIPPAENDANDEEANTDEAEEGDTVAVSDPTSPTNAKWVKKVSLSVGGYKTSFQFSDPMSNLADAVNDALNINELISTAQELDGINSASKESAGEDDDAEEIECDYDENPTELFIHLQQRAWGLALTRLQKEPSEARVWVYRKAKPEKAPDVPDAKENPEALVVQHQSIVVHDGNEMPKFRWKLLPLHAAIVLGAPTEIIQDIIRAYPNAAKKTDERGSLPVHLAASRLDVDPEGEKVVLQLFGAYADSIETVDRKGRTPPELAKLARARKDIEEDRKMKSAEVASQIGQECTASQYGPGDEDDEEEVEKAEEGGDDDDDSSVKSSLSGKFQQMLRRSKSSDTVDRRKKSKKKDKKKNKNKEESSGIFAAKSLDANDSDDGDVADDATIVESLGPGFAFKTTSKNQEVREQAATEEDVEKEEEEASVTDEELLVAAKKAMIAAEYQIHEQVPLQDTSSMQDVPLPMSFCDDGSVTSFSSRRSTKSTSSKKSRKSSLRKKSIKEDAPQDGAKEDLSQSVKISEEAPETKIIENTTADDNASSEDNEFEVNEGLRQLLEKAVENAGRRGVDVTEFCKILQVEWVTDVEALRRVEGEILDDLLPLMLSRELQRLINHADSIDTKFLKDEKTRGRSPKKSSKKKKKKRSHKRINKRNHFRPGTPTEGPLTPISELDEDPTGTPGSVDSGGDMTIRTEYSHRSAPGKLQMPQEEEDEDDEDITEEETDIANSASIEDLEIRKLHANLIADARKKFPTREALEDSIRTRQAEVEAAVNSGFEVDKQTLARAALADDEVRKLLPLRLILPTITDLSEMIGVLQMHKEGAMRSLDMDNARNIQSEIDELQDQINKEERYVMKKKMADVEPAKTKSKVMGILKKKEKKSDADSVTEAVEDSRDDISGINA